VSLPFGSVFDKTQRRKLFDLINELPTVADEVAKYWKVERSRAEAIATNFWNEWQ
jgi:hypothetical protein